MKRLDSSDSLGGLISICHSAGEENVMGAKNNNHHHVYSRGFQSMLDGLDEEDCAEESGHLTEKKRRLNVDQVKALEKNFEVENKLEPERKVKLAQELGLQPRQVAIWFQNRRARWKTKQLERDYGVLKANYDALKHSFDSVQQDKDALLAEIKELKSKLQEDNSTETKTEIKEEIMVVTESDNIVVDHSKTSAASVLGESESTDMNHDSYNSKNGVIGTSSLYGDLKDGSSDSDSSAILNEDNNSSPNNAAISSSGVLQHQQQQLMMSPSLRLNCSSSSSDSPPTSLGCFQFSDSKMISTNTQKPYHQQQYQFVRMEEHNFFGAEEPCNFYSEDQAPTLHWYYSDQWN